MDKENKDNEVMKNVEVEVTASDESSEAVNESGALTVEFEEIPEPPETDAKKTPEGAPKSNKKKDNWASRPVTGKVLAIALGIAVLVNAAFTAGISAVFAKKNKMPDMSSRPGSEMMGGRQHGNGQMTPPGGSSDGSQGQFGKQSQSDQQGQSQSSGPSIGIVVMDDSGIVIAQITGEKAKIAGFQEGDKIIKIDGTEVSTSSDLVSEVKSHSAGDTVTLTVERDGQQMEIKTELE